MAAALRLERSVERRGGSNPSQAIWRQWFNLVEHPAVTREVAGSNPVCRPKYPNQKGRMKKPAETTGNIVVLVPDTLKKEVERLEEIMKLIKDNRVKILVLDKDILQR